MVRLSKATIYYVPTCLLFCFCSQLSPDERSLFTIKNILPILATVLRKSTCPDPIKGNGVMIVSLPALALLIACKPCIIKVHVLQVGVRFGTPCPMFRSCMHS